MLPFLFNQNRLALVIACASVAALLLGHDALGRDRWTPEQAWLWYHSQPRLFGANYVMTYAVTPTEMWQADPIDPEANTFDLTAIENELDKAQETGFNTLRVTLSYEVWKADRDGFMNRLDQFVDAAADRGIRPALIFWDDVNFTNDPNVPTRQPYLGPQADPVPGMHNSQWTGTGGFAVLENSGNWSLPRTNAAPGAGAMEYVQDIVGAYAGDERVLMWNAYNEPANGGQSVENAQALIQATANWARAMDPMQPISFDVWGPAADGTAAAESDVISYHNYSGPASTIAGVRTQLSKYGRPVFLTEWMARTFGSTIPDILPDLQELGVGAFNWGLVNGDQQTHWPWGSPPQDVDPEPDVWFHDLYRRDGTPYNVEEIKLYQHYRQLDTVLRSADSHYIAIENPSFEADDLGEVPDAHVHRQFEGWTIIQEQGPWVGGTIVPDTWHFREDLPNGTQAMFAVDIEVGQVLTDTLQADSYYVLQVAIGHRTGRNLPEYDIDLLAGGVELTPLTYGYSNPLEGTWVDASKVFQVDPSHPQVGQPLEIRLRSTDYETFFDHVRLVEVESFDEIGLPGDLDMNGVLNSNDWSIFVANNLTDLSGYTPAQQFLHGDLNRDGVNDFEDYDLFRTAFDLANGQGAFRAMLDGVPEPNSCGILSLILLAGVVASANRMHAKQRFGRPQKSAESMVLETPFISSK